MLFTELGNQSASVFSYNVSTQPVSLHQPLSRYIAGLHLRLHQHNLSYHSEELDIPDKSKPTPEELIGKCIRVYELPYFRNRTFSTSLLYALLKSKPP